MSLSAGQSLSFYEILAPLGAGGMGEVYRARDTRLEREVAIKVLPQELASDDERLRRFDREAKMLASLNHTNIAGIHGIDQVGDVCFLAMELVPGEDLEQRLKHGPLPLTDAIDICRQIAEGLELAHEAGVVHRDLKPANVRVTPEGVVKLLDFGLAKPIRPEVPRSGTKQDSGSALSDSFLVTSEGMILGTPTYMSPEQARGKPVDRRTDIWAFGCVLYECLSGKRAFVGDAFGDLIVAILERDADLSVLPAATPPAVRELIKRCLVKDPRKRLRDIGEARLLLEDSGALSAGAPSSMFAAGEPKANTRSVVGTRTWLAILGLALATSLIALVTLLRSNKSAPWQRPLHLSVEPPSGARILFAGDFAGPPVVSPDGTSIAFAATQDADLRQLYLRRMGQQEALPLGGTESAAFPFWSMDGREIGYFSKGKLCRYDVETGTVNQVVDVLAARGGAFTGDGRILFTKDFRSGLSIVDANGGKPASLTVLNKDEHTSHRWPAMIAGTDKFIFSAVTAVVGEESNNGIYLGTLDSGEPARRILSSDFSAQYVDGWLLHAKDGSLLAVKLDLDSGEIQGHPIVLAKNLATDMSTWHGQFSASPKGLLAFHKSTSSAEGASQIGYSWSGNGDRISSWSYEGRQLTTYAAGTLMYSMALSPDGTTIAMDALSPDGYTDIWLCPTRHPLALDSEQMQAALISPEDPKRLTFLPGLEYRPVWSPDSTELVFRWDGDESHPRGIYRKRVGGGSETLVRDNRGEDDHPSDWTSDGQYLVVTTDTLLVSPKNDIIAVALDGGAEIPLVTGPGPQRSGKVSPDGRWLAYVDSNQNSAVFVIPFAPAWPEDKPPVRWLISQSHGYAPRWSRAGDELYYMTQTGTLMAVSVETGGDSFSFSTPRALFQAPWELDQSYDPVPPPDPKAAPNLAGKASQFLILDSDRPADGPISILLGWQTLLGDN